MYEFIKTETGWKICWGPLPVAEKARGTFERLKRSLTGLPTGTAQHRVRFIQVEQPAACAPELARTKA